jgi:hypothetical protein
MGVDTTWEFQMPRAANPFDYRTIADVLVTVEYTALNNLDFRQQVIKTLDSNVSAERSYSFRNQFPDQWYALHNVQQPAQPAQPLTICFSSLIDDFPPNLLEIKIQQLLLYVSRVAGEARELDILKLKFSPVDGTPAEGGATTIDGVISTRRGSGDPWLSMIGKAAIGDWEITLPENAQSLFTNDKIEDMLFVISYRGRVPDWPV